MHLQDGGTLKYVYVQLAYSTTMGASSLAWKKCYGSSDIQILMVYYV